MVTGTTEPTQAVEEFKARLRELSVISPGLGDEARNHSFGPHHWRWEELLPVLRETAKHHVNLTKGGGERRLIRLATPGVPGAVVTNTMSISLQYLLPGEIAPAHRHTPVAFRFFLEGEAYTTVEGEQFAMQRGDLVITPYLEWHDHGNDGSAPAIWIDGLDFPLVEFLNTDVMEYDVLDQQNTEKSGMSERRWSGVGLRPAWKVEPDDERLSRRSMVHYKWSETERILRGLADVGDADPFDDVFLEYVNPATARSAFKTIACCIQLIRPAVRTRAHRHTGSAVYHVLDGSGYAVIDGQRIDLSMGDFLVIPPLAAHSFGNDRKAGMILFSIRDTPTYKALGLYREEACD